MGIFDSLKRKLKKSKETETAERTMDAITTSSEKPKLETRGRDTEIHKKEWTIGDKIENRYEIYNIMRGGMGIIYVCYDHEFQELVALKTFQDKYLWNEEIINRFMEEAEIRLKLGEHENIVSTKFIDFIEGKPYIVLEYIAGDEKYGADLSGWIARGGLNPPLALDFAIQFCNGMDYAHTKFKEMGKSFVHRNVKPSNILITQDRVVKVTGFGLAKIFDEMSGAICGTPPYMSPEQFMGSKDIDVRSDIYSFGCVLYEMLTGKLPFVGRSFVEFRDKQLNEKTKNPKVVNPLIPSALDSVVMKCLEKKPENRYQSFKEVKKELIKSMFRRFGRDRALEQDKSSVPTIIPTSGDEAVPHPLSIKSGLHEYHWTDFLARKKYKFISPLSINVCVAEDMDGKMVVIKKSQFGGPDGIPTYDDPRNEIHIHSKLNHPNIVKLLRWHDEEEGLFIVTQYVDGETLARRFFLRPGEQKEVFPLLLQITNAVAYLHDMGVIHRDITPENIVVSGTKAFLIDFGFATNFSLANPPLFSPMTVITDEKILFSHAWLRPPEIRMGPSSDVFYLGVAGIFMLTGHLLFEFKHIEIIEQIIDFLPKVNPTVSNDFRMVLKKAVSPEIGLRFRNGREMLTALEGVEKY